MKTTLHITSVWLVGGLLVWSGLALAAEPPVPDYVVPAGQEALLEGALAPEGGLDGGWKMTRATIERVHIDVTLAGPAGAAGAEIPTVALRLVHPSQASAAATRAGPFAIEPPDAGGAQVDAAVNAAAAGLQTLATRFVWSKPGGFRGRSPKGPDTAEAKAKIVDLLGRARHEVAAGDNDRARRFVADALAVSIPGSKATPAWLELQAGSILLSAGAKDQGAAALQRALGALQGASPDDASQPLSHEAMRARALWLLGKRDEAEALIATLQKAAADDGATGGTPAAERRICALSRVARTMAVDKSGLDPALKLLDWVLQRTPRCREAIIAYASACRDHKQFDRAAAVIEAGAKLLPDDAGVVSQLANYRKFQDRRDEAIALLEGLARNGHAEPGLLGELLGLYTRAGIPRESLAMFRKKADEDPDDLVSAFFAGVLLHYTIKGSKELRDKTTPPDAFDVSNAYLRRAEARFASEPRLYIYLAMNRYHVGDLDEAARLIEHAIRIGPSDPDVYYCRAVIGMESNPTRALRDFERYRSLTDDAFDKSPTKERFVLGVIEDLRVCEHARDPQACIEGRRGFDRWGLVGGVAAAVLLLLGVVVVWRRRRTAAALVLVGLAPLASLVWLSVPGEALAASDPPPPPTAEAPRLDPQALALLTGADGTPWQPPEGWTLTRALARPDRVVFTLAGPDGAPLAVQLVASGREDRALARTQSFDVTYRGVMPGGPDGGSVAAQVFADLSARVAANDRGQLQLTRSVVPRVGPNVPYTLAGQWSWLTGQDRVLVGTSAGLWLAGLFFSRWSSPRRSKGWVS